MKMSEKLEKHAKRSPAFVYKIIKSVKKGHWLLISTRCIYLEMFSIMIIGIFWYKGKSNVYLLINNSFISNVF